MDVHQGELRSCLIVLVFQQLVTSFYLPLGLVYQIVFLLWATVPQGLEQDMLFPPEII